MADPRRDLYARISYLCRTDNGQLIHCAHTEEWTEVWVTTPGLTHCEQAFKVSDHGDRGQAQYRAFRLVDILRAAFEAGERNKLRDIQKMLQITPPGR